MAELNKSRMPGTIQPNWIPLSGTIEVSGGVITNQTGNRNSGVTWARQAAGDYRATLHKAYRRCMAGLACVSKNTNGTTPTLAAGNQAMWTGITSAMMLGTSGLTTTAGGIVTFRTDTNVLADPTNGDFINWVLLVSESP